jgi:hypothetical protein
LIRALVVAPAEGGIAGTGTQMQRAFPSRPMTPSLLIRPGGRSSDGGKRRQQLLACLFTSATNLGANTAVLMVIGVPLTLVRAQSARLSARLHDQPR